MKRAFAGFGAVVLGLALGVAAQDVAKEIRVSAKKYEYTPSEIRVRAGEKVRLILTVEDRTHGFELEPLNVKEKILKGKETIIEFEAPAPGTYEFKCSVWCGFGHKRMKGKLIVEAAGGQQP